MMRPCWLRRVDGKGRGGARCKYFDFHADVAEPPFQRPKTCGQSHPTIRAWPRGRSSARRASRRRSRHCESLLRVPDLVAALDRRADHAFSQASAAFSAVRRAPGVEQARRAPRRRRRGAPSAHHGTCAIACRERFCRAALLSAEAGSPSQAVRRGACPAGAQPSCRCPASWERSSRHKVPGARPLFAAVSQLTADGAILRGNAFLTRKKARAGAREPFGLLEERTRDLRPRKLR